MLKTFTRWTPFLLALVVAARAVEPVTGGGEQVLRRLLAMEVETHWVEGAPVDWRTGEPTGRPARTPGNHTHCSQFVAAACERLGVYILRPPEHGSLLLANAQFDWLRDQGPAHGWQPIANGVEAQDFANRGWIVAAVSKAPDPTRPGHIAIVRPGQKTAELIAKEGPDVIQAGAKNSSQISLKFGFAEHPGAFRNGGIRFFAHPVTVAE